MYSIRDFVALDRLFNEMPTTLEMDPNSRFAYSSDKELQAEIQEGEIIERAVVERKRSRNARQLVLRSRGPSCQVCDMTFKEVYGVEYAEVHHLKPLAETGQTMTQISRELLVVCRNCHAMLHSREFKGLSWRTLRRTVLARRRR